MDIRISSVVNDSIVDGPGLRLAVFTQGCFHHCPQCHNPLTHDPLGGKLTDTEKILDLLRENPILDGVTLTGGEPFLQAEACSEIAQKTKEMGLNVWTYSGYTYEELLSSGNPHYLELLQNTDVLIDGLFEKDLRSLELKFRGSKNQRVIDVAASLETGTVVDYFK